MPAKPIRSKRRGTTPEALLQAWSMTFESGVDFLGDVLADGDAHTCNPRVMCRCKFPFWGKAPPREMIEQRWRELGAVWLARRQPGDAVPWAVREFGAP